MTIFVRLKVIVQDIQGELLKYQNFFAILLIGIFEFLTIILMI